MPTDASVERAAAKISSSSARNRSDTSVSSMTSPSTGFLHRQLRIERVDGRDRGLRDRRRVRRVRIASEKPPNGRSRCSSKIVAGAFSARGLLDVADPRDHVDELRARNQRQRRAAADWILVPPQELRRRGADEQRVAIAGG
jgi:hypothetical protein